MTNRSISALLLSASLLTACGAETVVHDLDEKEANDIVVLLANRDIVAKKTMRDTGRQVFYNITVPSGQRIDALEILTSHNYPRGKRSGYGEVFQGDGLIPTAAEEKAKKLQAIEGEIEKQLSVVDGIIDVEVNVVMPDESALRTAEDQMAPTTASVTVKYMGGKDGAKPLNEGQIETLVAAGVEKLTADKVKVIMTEASTGMASSCPESTGKGKGILGRLGDKAQKGILAGAITLFLLLSLLIVFGQVRLRNVRARLIRLQDEIAKARRKATTESLPAPTE